MTLSHRGWAPRRLKVFSIISLAALLLASVAHADPPAAEASAAADADDEDAMPPPGYLPGHRERVGLGLSPHAPDEQSVLPGGVTPAFAAPLRPAEGAKFDFHGYVQAGSRASFNTRTNPTSQQSSTVWHGDPIVPRGNVFENTNTVPYTWAELRFSYSTPSVTANVSLGAWSLSETMQASGAFNPNGQLWIRDAFLNYVPRGLDPVKLNINVGVYEDRYGGMGEYGSGQYGAPLIATISGVGETMSASVPLGRKIGLTLEHGIKARLDRPPVGVPTGPANNWPKPWEGQTFVNHAHVGLDINGVVQPALHLISAFARDDQADQASLGSLRAGYIDYNGGALTVNPAQDHGDASLQILAADVRVQLHRYGYFYTGVSHTSVDHVRSLTGVVQVLNAGGGRDLMDRYFGRNNDRGRGTLTLVGGEYSVSLGEILRLPDEFWGEGPDLRVSVFGMFAHVTSDDPARDGEDQLKFGAEGTYSALPWLAIATRVDHAIPYLHRPGCAPQFVVPFACPLYTNQNDNAFSVLTLKAVFRSDWLAREALTLQYSKFFYRPDFHLVTLNAGGQVSNVTNEPDQHLLALYGTLWW